MPKQRRCPYCRRLFIPDPRRKERQATCGRQECRRKRKRQSDMEWRSRHQEYYRGIYQQQKEDYGTRAEYKKQYRRRNPDYVRRNAAFVKKYRERHREAQSHHVSHTSCDLRLSLWKEMAPKHPCSYPGCAALVKSGDSRCEMHRLLVQREMGQVRGSSASRGYGSKWRTARKEFLRSNPLCIDCHRRGIPRVATVVDHIIPHKGDSDLFWDRSNWQALCKKCHDRKTAVSDGRWR